jgi:DNA-binding NarL/FixJ family response regulator
MEEGSATGKSTRPQRLDPDASKKSRGSGVKERSFALLQGKHCPRATTAVLHYAILRMFWVQELFGHFGVPLNLGGCLVTSAIRVLVVDDFEPFRGLLCSTLQNKLEIRNIVEASDGVEAIDLAKTLQPDLILLDIGLPTLDGIEVARRIRELVPRSRILFVSQESSLDVVQAAFSAGASGYVVKIDVGSELPTAVKAVLRGEKFVGSRFAGCGIKEVADERPPGRSPDEKVLGLPQRQTLEKPHRHEAGFYSDDASLLASFTRFIGASLNAGHAVIVIATESHRDSLLSRLKDHGLDVVAAIKAGRYISLDAAETISTFMVNNMPDPVRFMNVTGDLLLSAAKAAKGEPPRVSACGECAPLLWSQGNAEAAIRLEHLWDDIAKSLDVDVLCGYPLGSFEGGMGSRIFDKLCAAHSGVHSR